MEIEKHLLKGIKFVKSPNIGGEIKPEYLIIHYDASSSASGAISWLTNKKSGVSAHISISRDGEIVQMVAFNIKAQHAGESIWRGIEYLNGHSIGIELQNTGNQEYTEKQMNALYELSKSLMSAYNLKEVIGHSDISPIRKTDPSGVNYDLFDWVEFYSNVCIPTKGFMTTDSLNMRVSYSTKYSIITVIPKDSKVYELNRLGDWSKVQFGFKVGYVANKYLI